MLLQTNSYIVPKERRAEHARLIRRFRQALARIGCDQFEVYEQVGANWSPGGANGRYVQIMRFRDRQHQQAVQAAERNDHGAQQIIAEFCDLINFPYQQQHGYFATGFYASVLPTGPRQAVEHEAQHAEEEEAPLEGAAATVDPFADRGMPPHIDPIDSIDPIDPIDSGAVVEDLQAGSDIPLDDAEGQSEEEQAPAETVPYGGDEEDGKSEAELDAELAAMEERSRFQKPSPVTADLGSGQFPTRIPPTPAAAAGDAVSIDAEVPAQAMPQDSAEMPASADPAESGDELLFEPVEFAKADELEPDLHPGESDLLADAPVHAATAHSHAAHPAPAIDETAVHETAELEMAELEMAGHETGVPETAEFETAEPEVAGHETAPHETAELETAAQETAADQSAKHEPLAAEFDLESEEFGLVFEDELPGDPPASADSAPTAEQEFELHESAPAAFVRRQPPPVIAPKAASLPPVAEHHEPHEELLPTALSPYDSDRAPTSVHDVSSDEADLDALLDDANLLDNVPLSGLDDAPRVHSRREPAGNGHEAPGEKDTDLFEIEAIMRELEDPSTDHGHLR